MYIANFILGLFALAGLIFGALSFVSPITALVALGLALVVMWRYQMLMFASAFCIAFALVFAVGYLV
jgi:hypothetical protein